MEQRVAGLGGGARPERAGGRRRAHHPPNCAVLQLAAGQRPDGNVPHWREEQRVAARRRDAVASAQARVASRA